MKIVRALTKTDMRTDSEYKRVDITPNYNYDTIGQDRPLIMDFTITLGLHDSYADFVRLMGEGRLVKIIVEIDDEV